MNEWLVDWLIDLFIDWLIDRSINRSVDWSVDWSVHWWVGWFGQSFIHSLIPLSIDLCIHFTCWAFNDTRAHTTVISKSCSAWGTAFNIGIKILGDIYIERIPLHHEFWWHSKKLSLPKNTMRNESFPHFVVHSFREACLKICHLDPWPATCQVRNCQYFLGLNSKACTDWHRTCLYCHLLSLFNKCQASIW